MIQVPASRPVSLQADSPEMAETYNATSVHQFNNGKLLIDLLEVEEGDAILDVGAGTGQLGAYVAQIVGSTGRVMGVDPLSARVEIAQRRSTGNFEMRVGQAEDLSQFRDHSFDVVYLNSVFHWLNDKPRGLAEIFRVLKPGGRLGFNTTIPDTPHEIAKLVRKALAQEGLELRAGINTNKWLDTPDDLRLLVTGAGFVDCRASEQTISDQHSDPESVIKWSASSQFGNFVASLDQKEFARFRSALVRLLEARQTDRGIHLERYLVFITARRPEQP
jgi:arsenite methyltransferase